jgi:hypothetical protein
VDGRDGVGGHAFISYVHEDSDQVDRLQQTLEAAGVTVWRDTGNLWPGEDWRVKIRHAITDGALVFIACFSKRSLARSKSYQNEELALAIQQLLLRRPDDPWLIPVRFDECEIPDWDIGGGRTLASIHRADLFGDRFDAGAGRLVTAVRRILGEDYADSATVEEAALGATDMHAESGLGAARPVVSMAEAPRAAKTAALKPKTETAARRRRFLIAIAVAAVILVGVGWGVVSLVSSPSPQASSTGGGIQGAVTSLHENAAVTEGYLPASGTVKNLKPGYRLLLFLQWTGDARYLGGNPNVIVRHGHWSGPKLLYVGARHPFILWLVAQGPETIKFMRTPLGEYRWGTPGFPSLKIASDSIVLYHVGLNVQAAGAVRGFIAQPTSGATVQSRQDLHASGTAENVPSNNRLWLFIEWKGVQKYWAGSPADFTLSHGRWSGKIYIGDPGNLILWLVDLGPKALHVMNTDKTGQNNGFPTLHLASDAKVLDSIPFTAR